MKRRLVFIGPPGAGKGTQAFIISRRLSIPRVATGDLLRDEIARGTELGMSAKKCVDDGKLVPDQIVNAILEARLLEFNDGFIIDGYPRTIDQAKFLENVTTLDSVVYFDAPEEVLVDRIINRRICPKCNSVYNTVEYPPKVDNLCDKDQTPLIQRTDDNSEIAKLRIRTFWEKTAPLIQYYFEKNLLAKINANQKFEAVTDEIVLVLNS
ncbi:MAG: nucleoside monophosphate kinase [Thermoplasmata archaeon]|uniref:Adenylate kinase n=1 Tax=Candidatus Sysuiplasma superficiale TaxID=2823368 RepID=A0A8J7YTT8_9ARCH|nr:nucleoside monophosphate kinase [Candidatus Sysuiplasma superficiale]MBX8644608.1 nucleoside monophosphate kinase [Candidatus Sysuiplasma superficiale]